MNKKKLTKILDDMGFQYVRIRTNCSVKLADGKNIYWRKLLKLLKKEEVEEKPKKRKSRKKKKDESNLDEVQVHVIQI